MKANNIHINSLSRHFFNSNLGVLFNEADIIRVVANYITEGHIIVFKLINKTCFNAVELSHDYLRAEEFCTSPSLLQWAISMGCPTAGLLPHCARQGYIKTLFWLRALSPQKWAWSRIPDGSHAILVAAAEGGHLQVFEAYRRMRPIYSSWNEQTCRAAAAGGHLHVLKWLRKQKPPCPWGEDTCDAAAAGGHLHVLKWLRKQSPPCPWGKDTCRAAAKGHLDVLQWLRRQKPPCPWDTQTTHTAIINGHFDVLIWLVTQDPPCPCDEDIADELSNYHI
jgi:hypothetical protein